MSKFKKGADKMISVYWFLIITLVAGGLVLMVNAYHGKPYDVRDVEAKMLSQKVADCIYFGGEVNPELMAVNGVFKESFRDSFLNNCNLNFDPVDDFEHEQYYVLVNFYKDKGDDEAVFSLKAGNENYVPDCHIEEGSKKISVCSTNDFWMNSIDNDAYYVEILSIVSKTDENVS